MATASDTYNSFITPIASGGAVTIDARSGIAVVVRAGPGATVTASAVDSLDAAAHTTGAENQITVSAGSFSNLFATLGPHSFYRVSSAGGSARVSVVP